MNMRSGHAEEKKTLVIHNKSNNRSRQFDSFHFTNRHVWTIERRTDAQRAHVKNSKSSFSPCNRSKEFFIFKVSSCFSLSPSSPLCLQYILFIIIIRSSLSLHLPHSNTIHSSMCVYLVLCLFMPMESEWMRLMCSRQYKCSCLDLKKRRRRKKSFYLFIECINNECCSRPAAYIALILIFWCVPTICVTFVIAFFSLLLFLLLFFILSIADTCVSSVK